MSTYHQLTSGERYGLSALRKQGLRPAAIARALGRHRSTICRELRRNSRKDGPYRPFEASQKARGRRSRSRRNHRFVTADWVQVRRLLRRLWSPEQIAARLRMSGELSISHETIYTYIWRDKRQGGSLYKNLRQAAKKRRKRYGRNDSRGRLRGKKPIEDRPQAADDRTEVGHLEGDTVMGSSDKHCILTLVDRKSGRVWIGKLENRTVDEMNRVAIRLINTADPPVRSLTLDNGTEFHGYMEVEAQTGVPVYFATPHHSWERATNENTNGLIRQYLPKRKSMKTLTQRACNLIANQLNDRPRKRLGFLFPPSSSMPTLEPQCCTSNLRSRGRAFTRRPADRTGPTRRASVRPHRLNR